MPSEHEIRALVAQVVDGLMAGAEPEPETKPTSQALPSEGVASIAMGADHGGYPLKDFLAFRLKERGHRVVDCGTNSSDAVDYPDFALAVAEKVASTECSYGIVVDGAGIGSAMVANKVPGVRASLCYDLSSAMNSREHNHANVLTLGAGLIGRNLALQIVETWLDTPWSEGRHARRVDKIMEIDRRYRSSQ